MVRRKPGLWQANECVKGVSCFVVLKFIFSSSRRSAGSKNRRNDVLLLMTLEMVKVLFGSALGRIFAPRGSGSSSSGCGGGGRKQESTPRIQPGGSSTVDTKRASRRDFRREDRTDLHISKLH